MIKKAVKRPDEIEYIEFKGRENFEEVCEFIGRSEPLLTRIDGTEYLLMNHFNSSEKSVPVDPGTIFYKWNNFGNDENIYGPTSWDITSKEEFFRMYKEEL